MKILQRTPRFMQNAHDVPEEFSILDYGFKCIIIFPACHANPVGPLFLKLTSFTSSVYTSSSAG